MDADISRRVALKRERTRVRGPGSRIVAAEISPREPPGYVVILRLNIPERRFVQY